MVVFVQQKLGTVCTCHQRRTQQSPLTLALYPGSWWARVWGYLVGNIVLVYLIRACGGGESGSILYYVFQSGN